MENKRKLTLIFYFILSNFIASYGQTTPIIPKIILEKDEKVWAGIIALGSKMPLEKGFKFDFGDDNLGNQLQPLLLTNKGRYVWSEEPFAFEITENEVIILNAKGEIKTGKNVKNLAQAAQEAQKLFFPTTGITPDLTFFSKPQYNTWIELNFNHNQADVLKYAHNIIKNGYEPGVLMIDNSWQEQHGNWNFHSGRFPNPKAMVDELHGLGFKVMLWVSPFVSPDQNALIRKLRKSDILLKVKKDSNYDYYKNGKAALIQWWDGYSVELDFSNPDAVTWFTDNLERLRKNYGIDGFKFDAGDMRFYPSFTDSFQANITPNKHSELFAKIGLNYPLNEYRACWKMGGQPLVQRLKDKLSNWEDLQKLLPDMLTASLVGYAYSCPDMIGGGEYKFFEENTNIDQDMVVRSAQCHALMPMMQFSVAPWRVLDEKHHQSVKKAVELRKKFTPQIMELVEESRLTGKPIVRFMEYVFPQSGFENIKDQFMLGDKILVAPQQMKGNRRIVKLPKGTWKSDENMVYEGNKNIEIIVPLERLPYFLKIK
jgi:alpha-glucosidase (family GH31 glycosyl hydrolase)